MTASSTTFHEPLELLSQTALEQHRAIVSLMEELEAVDWYAQRVEASQDPELRAILAHNRDEEIEHATMVLEWLRRHDPKFDAELRERLFRPGPIVTEEHGAEDSSGPPAGDGSLGIGSLREARS